MAVEPSKLNHREDMALVALLTQPTIADAARQTGVGEATLYRWLQQPEFQARYRAVRRQLLEQTVTQLHTHASEAVATLIRNQYSGHAPTEVRAAVALLTHLFKGAELLDLQERLATLEEAVSAHEDDNE